MLLTQGMIQKAISEIPKHRTQLRRDLRNTLDLVKRGIKIEDNAPVWKQVQNVIFVAKIDVDIKDTDSTVF